MSQLEVRDCDKHGALAPFVCGQCAQDAMRARAEAAEAECDRLSARMHAAEDSLTVAEVEIERLRGYLAEVRLAWFASGAPLLKWVAPLLGRTIERCTTSDQSGKP